MKKATLTFLAAWLLLITGLKAQTIQEGINHLYAKRYKSAVEVFQKMLATNPNNIEAIYWLGQGYFNMDDNTAARQLYEKALTTNGSAPLILVGIGQADLLDNKTIDAQQRFGQAIIASHNKKGDDPVVQTAIGRAIVDSKTGDFTYAVKLLEDAAAKDPKNTETLLQLGNAYRKADPGQGGGKAYESYKKALEVNPNFAVASLRLAKLFESQKNWEFVLQYLNEAIAKDSRFSDAYFELFYYYFYRQSYSEAEDQLKKYINSKAPQTDIQDQSLYAQLCWAKKDFDCAVSKSEAVVAAMGDKTKPQVYRLLADSYYQNADSLNKKGDSVNAKKNYANAKKYSDAFFAKKNPEDVTLYDYQLRADILGKTGGTDDEVLNTYMQGASVDTLASLKVDLLKKGAAYFKEKKLRDKEALLITKIIELKPKPTINDYFDLTLAYYFDLQYGKSRDQAIKMIEKYSDQVYGYEWAFYSARLIDTVKKDSIAVPDALKLFDFSSKDTAKFKKQIISSASYLAIYYANDAKDKEKAIDFLKKWQAVDIANADNIQKNIDLLMKTPAAKPPGSKPAKGTTPAKTGTSKQTATSKSKTAMKKSIAKN